MKKILIAVVLALGVSSAFSQTTLNVNIEGTDARFVFRNNAKTVQFCIGSDYGDILNVVEVSDPNENGCFYFTYIAKERITIFVCDDNSLAAVVGDEIKEGYWVNYEDNGL
jgi:hypothetical protein